MASTSQATAKTFPVILHIYDASHLNPLLRVANEVSPLNPFLRVFGGIFSEGTPFNELLRSCGGFYRSAVEVHGVEYMFLDYITNSGRNEARLFNLNPSKYATVNKGLKLYLSIVVGRTQLSNEEAYEAVRRLPLDTFYTPVNNNSHHFAGRVCELLIGNRTGYESVQWVGQCDLLESNVYRFLKVKVRENMLTANDRSTATFPVVLNVYKVPSGAVRRCLGIIELSVYRSSVEVHGVEYMFCEHDGVAGIMMMTPWRIADEKGLEFAESIVMGRTEMQNAAQVRRVVERVGSAGGYGVYPINVYDYISKNCHHFSDDLCNALVGKGIPGWIKRGAFYERNYTGEALTGREKIGRGLPQRWTDGTLFMNRNPPMDRWLVRKLNNITNTNDDAHMQV